MAETYSLAVKGARADSVQAVQNVKVGDTIGADGAYNLPMMRNTQLLCKNPDGSQTYYTIDAERSTPNNLVMKPVGP